MQKQLELSATFNNMKKFYTTFKKYMYTYMARPKLPPPVKPVNKVLKGKVTVTKKKKISKAKDTN